MEACFLSSDSFSKTIAFSSSSTKARFLVHPKRNCNQIQSRKVGFPLPTTCCRLGSSSSSPPEDETNPVVNSDWRSFRARLVAGERAFRSDLLPPEMADDCLPVVPVADKWAHTIREPERGCLLIADEKLDGVHIFERTVILLLATGPVGPTGVILNRPSLMSIKETKSTALDADGIFSDRRLFFGGPLEEDGLFLVRPKEGGEEAHELGLFDEVMGGLYYGTRESVGCAAEMVKREVVGIGDFRFFDGYCGWDREQLRDEIRAGYWTVAACSPSVIGLDGGGGVGLWEEVIGLMGPKKVW